MTLHESVTNKNIINKFKTLEDTFKKVHNDKYDYSLSVYINTSTKIIINCPEHGEFMQSPDLHKRGGGCPQCGNIQRGISKAFSDSDFIERANKVHNLKYDYSLIKYKNNSSKLKIICPEHGEFEQVASYHLSGNGCTKCAKKKLSNNLMMSYDEFISRAVKKHNDKFDYSLTEYKGMDKEIKIICNIHGIFRTTPYRHLKGKGSCPICTEKHKRKKYFDKPTILYYIKIEKEGFDKVYKIGITTKSVEQRFKKDINKGIKITILKEELFNKGEFAYFKEQLILNSLKEYKYQGDDILLFGGNSELFDENQYLF